VNDFPALCHYSPLLLRKLHIFYASLRIKVMSSPDPYAETEVVMIDNEGGGLSPAPEEHAQAPDGDGGGGGENLVLEIPSTPDATQGPGASRISAVTFAGDSVGRGTTATNDTGTTTAGRKVHREDFKQIFMASVSAPRRDVVCPLTLALARRIIVEKKVSCAIISFFSTCREPRALSLWNRLCVSRGCTIRSRKA